MKQRLVYITALLAALASTTCCKSGPKSSLNTNSSEDKNLVYIPSKIPFNLKEKRYTDLLGQSLVSTGNNYRTKKFLDKLKSGADVYIATLGGSVTEGAGPKDFHDGYAYQFIEKLKTEFTQNNGTNIHFDNAGLSGTPSTLGLVRYHSDVVDVLGQTPDLLIIEFAVNDDNGDQCARAFEALVRNALTQNSETAVIALYSAATYGNSAVPKKAVANHYEIPQVDILPGYKNAVTEKDFTQKQYLTDSVHPTKEGHQFQADCLMTLLKKIDSEDLSEASPVPANWLKNPDKALTNFTRIYGDDQNVKIDVGGFSATDKSTQNQMKSSKQNFPKNWHKSATSGSKEFAMKIKCKSLILTYKEQGSWLSEKFGKAEIYVDGKLTGTYDGAKEGGWCNCVQLFLIDESEEAEHEIIVKMAEGDEDKGFTIVAMGYSTN